MQALYLCEIPTDPAFAESVADMSASCLLDGITEPLLGLHLRLGLLQLDVAAGHSKTTAASTQRAADEKQPCWRAREAYAAFATHNAAALGRCILVCSFLPGWNCLCAENRLNGDLSLYEVTLLCDCLCSSTHAVFDAPGHWDFQTLKLDCGIHPILLSPGPVQDNHSSSSDNHSSRDGLQAFRHTFNILARNT